MRCHDRHILFFFLVLVDGIHLTRNLITQVPRHRPGSRADRRPGVTSSDCTSLVEVKLQSIDRFFQLEVLLFLRLKCSFGATGSRKVGFEAFSGCFERLAFSVPLGLSALSSGTVRMHTFA